MKKIYVIGAGVEGQEGFSRRALDLIGRTEILLGGSRQLKLFPDFPGEKVIIGDNLAEIVDLLKKTDRQVVVLSSGDPLFFGIGRYLLRNLPEERLDFVPNVSSVQYAFSKLKEPCGPDR
jgi:precorrin-6Y C5,15-methyltransferase (decarboxylating)